MMQIPLDIIRCVVYIELKVLTKFFLCSSKRVGYVVDINVKVGEAWFPVILVKK